MKVIEEPQQAETDLHESQGVNSEALIKEARQRQRRRWLVRGLVLLIVVAASGIWAASGGQSVAKPPASKTATVQSSGVTGLPGARHTNPLSLVGTWRVIAAGAHPAPMASIGSLGLVVWTSCGWMSGNWNADRQGLFVGILSGGVPACASSYANLNPPWLAATGYKRAGRDELLLGAAGRVLARLVPSTVPPSYAKDVSPDYLHPVVTPELRKVLLQVSRPLSAGLVAASGRQLLGRWVPAKASPGRAPHQPYLSFNADGNWSGSDGCNGLRGRLSLGSGGSIIVAAGPQTTMLCTGITFVGKWLVQASLAGFQGRTLVFIDATGKVTGRLRRG